MNVKKLKVLLRKSFGEGSALSTGACGGADWHREKVLEGPITENLHANRS